MLLNRLSKPQQITIAEKIFFGLMLLVLALPVTGSSWFLTEDGASHSYNAGVLYNLLSGNDEFLGQYYEINTLPSPNWLGHLLLAYTGHWLGVAEAAKILHLVYIAGFALAFRRLMFTVSPQPRVMSYLAFPLLYNVIFLFGFYNFCLGMVVMLIVINVWLRYQERPKLINAILLGIMITLLWFSHQLPWFFAGLFIFFHLIYQLILRKQFVPVLKKATVALLASLPSLICLAIYMSHNAGGSGVVYESVSNRWNMFSGGEIFKMFYSQEADLGKLFLLVVVIMLLLGIVRFMRLTKSMNNNPVHPKLFWFFIFVISFFAMLFFPETIGDGGVIGIRVMWIAWVFLLILVAQFRLPSRAGYAVCAVSLLMPVMRNSYFSGWIHDNNLEAHAARGAGKYIKDHSTILILPFATNWLNLHIGQYAIAGREIVLLDNYEADHNYFPIKWNFEKMPYNYQLASLNASAVPCSWSWPSLKDKENKQVDYVMIVGDLNWEKDTVCSEKIACAMDSLDYRAVYKKRQITLYEYFPD
ncbi:MAG: hypothetical protein MUC87_09400 [Bacteroidia bacterium]|jgi:hypothetical protein|nr:hypothetical protein [Bacteroidia bacterium]